MEKPTVWIVNKSAHNYEDAKRYGNFRYLSVGEMPKHQTNNIHRKFQDKLRESKPDDLILLSGLSVMNCIATSIFAVMHGRLNLLIYKNKRYVERNLILEDRDEDTGPELSG